MSSARAWGIESHLLTLVTFVPLVGAILVLLLPRRQEHVTKLATLGTTLVTFAISLPVYFRFDAASADYQFVEQRAWIPSLGVSYHVGVDGISVLLVLLTTFLMPLVLLSWQPAIAISATTHPMPLDYNNRLLAAAGLKRMRQGQCQPGVRARPVSHAERNTWMNGAASIHARFMSRE